MAMKIQRQDNEDVSGTKGRYYFTLEAKKGLVSSDGHALTHEEGVVISCPGCGAPQGIGFDSTTPKIINGKTDRPWTCYDKRCQYTVDVMEFEGHQEPAAREIVAKKKAAALDEIGEARVRRVVQIHRENELADLNDRVDREARAMLGSDGLKNGDAVNKVLADLMKKRKAT